jgi:hypothetical protein
MLVPFTCVIRYDNCTRNHFNGYVNAHNQRFVVFRADLSLSIPENQGFAPTYVSQPKSWAGRTQKKGQPEGQPDVSVAVQYHQGKHQDP